MPAPTAGNLLALGNLLIDLAACLAKSPDVKFGPDHHDALARGHSLSFTTTLGDVDIVQRLPGVQPYASLVGDALEVPLPSGVTIAVASLANLRAMKSAAGRPQDLLDLDALPPS